MYQNPFFTRRKPEFRGDSPSMSPADMTRDEGMFQRRQRYIARKNPLIAKPVRYDEPKGGYQQPGAPATGAYPPGAYAKPLNQVYGDPKGGGMHDRPVVREPIDRFANDDSIRNVDRNGQPKSPAALEMLRRRQLA